MLLRTSLWMFHPTLLTGSLVTCGVVRDRGLLPNCCVTLVVTLLPRPSVSSVSSEEV